MTNEAYYHGTIDFSPLDATVENIECIEQDIIDIFGEGDDTFYVDFEEDSIIFEGYSEPDDDEFTKHINEVSECLQRHGSHITECDLEINDGFSKAGKVIIWNGEVVFLDTEATAIHDATDTELLNELKRRGKDYERLLGIARDFISIEAEGADPDYFKEVFRDTIGIAREEAEQLGIDTDIMFGEEE